MKTLILEPNDINIKLCADKIKQGGIAAFPTETVYGLGGSAFNEDAAKKIYEAKGRPSDNPLIVHIARESQISEIATGINSDAKALIKNFMPGAITLVLERKPNVPKIITGGLETVAVRMPSHNVARKLIEFSGIPIAAPSANRSTRPSPTTAKHVYDDLSGKIEYILDGGECVIGLESTIVDMTSKIPKILRTGGITIEEIEKAVGRVEINTNTEKILCPGMKYKHYSPKADVFFSAYYDKMENTIIEKYNSLFNLGKNPVIISLSTRKHLYGGLNLIEVGDDYGQYAKHLFWALRYADEKGYDCIIAEGVKPEGIGATIINRLTKSSGGQII